MELPPARSPTVSISVLAEHKPPVAYSADSRSPERPAAILRRCRCIMRDGCDERDVKTMGFLFVWAKATSAWRVMISVCCITQPPLVQGGARKLAFLAQGHKELSLAQRVVSCKSGIKGLAGVPGTNSRCSSIEPWIACARRNSSSRGRQPTESEKRVLDESRAGGMGPALDVALSGLEEESHVGPTSRGLTPKARRIPPSAAVGREDRTRSAMVCKSRKAARPKGGQGGVMTDTTNPSTRTHFSGVLDCHTA